MDDSALNVIAQVVRKQMIQHQALLQGAITPHQKRLVLGAFVQGAKRQPQASFRAYQPQSSEIFGILKQMKETFEANLSDSQKEELANAKAYQEQRPPRRMRSKR
jgi:hypothetical protein